jgi:hypothetical protein
MIGDMRQHVTQPGFGVDTVQLGCADQRVDRRCALAAAVGAGEQVCLIGFEDEFVTKEVDQIFGKLPHRCHSRISIPRRRRSEHKTQLLAAPAIQPAQQIGWDRIHIQLEKIVGIACIAIFVFRRRS